MAKEEKKTAKRCFVVGHIGAEGSAERLHGDWVLEEIVRTAIESPALTVSRADNITHPGMIDGQIIRELLEADLVVADLSMLNPNVLYEIGIRHMAQKPIVHMFLGGTQLPFDLRQSRAISFMMATADDMKRARTALRLQAESALASDARVDNPVTVAMGRVEFERTASDAEQVLSQQLSELSSRVDRMERTGGAALTPYRLPIRSAPNITTKGDDGRINVTTIESLGSLKVEDEIEVVFANQLLFNEVNLKKFLNDVSRMFDGAILATYRESSPRLRIERPISLDKLDSLLGHADSYGLSLRKC